VTRKICPHRGTPHRGTPHRGAGYGKNSGGENYAINCDKLKQELDWKQSVDFSEGQEKTIRWYLDHQEWVREIESGEYRKWIEQNFCRITGT
jgi:nucleoside-diphosphate-sugar epimerase